MKLWLLNVKNFLVALGFYISSTYNLLKNCQTSDTQKSHFVIVLILYYPLIMMIIREKPLDLFGSFSNSNKDKQL